MKTSHNEQIAKALKEVIKAEKALAAARSKYLRLIEDVESNSVCISSDDASSEEPPRPQPPRRRRSPSPESNHQTVIK